MIALFRKFQRPVFLSLTVLFILSFAFFGVSSSILSDREPRQKDRVVAYAIDGSPMMLSEIQALSRFIATDQQDWHLAGAVPNFCNDGVLRNDFLESGLSDLLMSAYPQFGLDASGRFSRESAELASQFILNAAKAAELKGFHVTLEEAKGDLLRNFQSAMQQQRKIAKVGPPITFQQHLSHLGLVESSASEIWQKVLLFRRYFQGIGQAAFADRLSFRDVSSYAREVAQVGVYRWPKAFCFANAQDLVEFQSYLKAVSPPLNDPLGLPARYLSAEEVKMRHPELVETHFVGTVANASLLKAALQASIKEVWDWQCEEVNWDRMRAVFPFLKSASSREERFHLLEKLSTAQRLSVDGFVRLHILDAHPEWLEGAFEVSKEQLICVAGPNVFLPQRVEGDSLGDLLSKAAAGEESAQQKLLGYRANDKTAYRIEGVRLSKPEHILTFEEAKRKGLTVKVADRILQEEYQKIREKSPDLFKNSNGGWKGYSEVKESVARIVFSDVFKKIEEIAFEEKSIENQSPFAYRMFPAAKSALSALRRDPLDSLWVSGFGQSPLAEQFKLIREELFIQRADKGKWMNETAFLMLPGEWSPMRVLPNEGVAFFYLMEKKPSDAPMFEQIAFGQELIVSDAQRYLAEKLLETIEKKQSMSASIREKVNEL